MNVRFAEDSINHQLKHFSCPDTLTWLLGKYLRHKMYFHASRQFAFYKAFHIR